MFADYMQMKSRLEVSDARNKSHWKMCTVCDTKGEPCKDSVYWCFECSASLCTSCFQYHQKRIAKHITTKADDQFEMLICQEHNGVSKYVCKSCARYCCLTCIMSSCSQHEVERFDRVLQQRILLREMVQNNIKVVVSAHDELASLVGSTHDDVIERIKNQERKLIQELHVASNKLCHQLTQVGFA